MTTDRVVDLVAGYDVEHPGAAITGDVLNAIGVYDVGEEQA